MKKKALVLLLFCMFFILSVGIGQVQATEDFSLDMSITTNSVCPSSTILIVATVQNIGDETSSYTISLHGDAARFSTAVPLGFSLLSGESRAVYVYVTPCSTVLPGSYSLGVSVSTSGGLSKSLTQQINVENCHIASLSAESPKEVCPGQAVTFKFTLQNNGLYLEEYDLIMSGTGSGLAQLSDNFVILDAGQTRDIFVNIAPIDDAGEYDLTVKAESRTSISQADARAVLTVLPCYEFLLGAETALFTLCENSEQAATVTVRNDGTVENTYNFFLTGPKFAMLDQAALTLGPGQEGIATLFVRPGFGEDGSYGLSLDATSSESGITKRIDMQIQVEACYDVLVNIVEESDSMCSGVTKIFPVSVKNKGRFVANFNLNLEGPEWTLLEESSVTLDPEQETAINLVVSPPQDVGAKTYSLRVTAEDPESQVRFSDSLSMEVVDIKNCYLPQISARESSLELQKDSSATMALTIENKGLKDASYVLGVEGTASYFVQLNPSTIDVKAGKSEVVHLYIAPSLETAEGTYKASVSARLKDGTILDSETVDIKVTPKKEGVKFPPIEIKKVKSMWQRVKSFFTGLFVREAKNVTGELEEVEEEAKPEEEVGEEVEPEAEPSMWQRLKNFFVKRILRQGPTIEINLTEEPEEVGEVESEEAGPEAEEEEGEEEKAVSGMSIKEALKKAGVEIKNFALIYKIYISFGVVLAIILLIILSGWWKNIVDFFTEEFEEGEEGEESEGKGEEEEGKTEKSEEAKPGLGAVREKKKPKPKRGRPLGRPRGRGIPRGRGRSRKR